MSRKRWRVSRAFRVLLACLALWLPARTAGAWTAPADTVVLMACATAKAALEARAQAANAEATPRDATRRAATDAHVASGGAGSCDVDSFLAPRETTASRAFAPPLYLLHCALLR